MSREARRVPAGLDVQVIQYPVPGASGPVQPATRSIPGRLTPAARSEPLQPMPFSERVAAAERAAFARGHTEGERAAAMAASVRVDAIVARFAAAIEQIAAARATMLQETERDLVRLALAMATHVLRRQVEVDPELLVSMARAALERLASASAVTIHVHPTDFEALSRQHPPAAASGSVEVIADPDVPRGGCVARTAGGTIDAGIDAQFSELTTALLGRHDERDRV